MSKIAVKGLQVLSAYVSDLDRSVKFYTEILGFRQIGEVLPGLTLRSGDLTLYLEPGRQSKVAESGNYAEFSPCFETESVKATYEILKNLGVSICEDYQEYSPEFAMFKISDPDGNVIEFAGNP
ncbi:MAG: VOC family protein [Candidatus Aegiribacteria sp.]|nr:VOC family protein [Candidatus Aegiribacteria sp.]